MINNTSNQGIRKWILKYHKQWGKVIGFEFVSFLISQRPYLAHN